MSATTVAFIAPQAPASNGATGLVRSVTGQPNPRSFVSPDGVVYELVWVTPDTAHEWLYRNNGNRSLRGEVVDKIGRDLKNGRFMENGDAVRFSADGNLLDGQHRLHAMVKSATPAWLLVVSNLPATARDTVDDGTKRTMADRFQFHGEASATTLAATVRKALLWELSLKPQIGRFTASTPEAFAFLAENPDLRDAARAADHYRKAKLLPASTIGLTWWLFNRINPAQCTEFFDRLGDGAMLPKGHAVLTLRNRLADINAQPGRLHEKHVLAMTIKAWNYYRDGRDLMTLRFAEHEKFPQPK
ncbi:hypothetical protein [Sphaerisporangium sp. TRM90804]|uniref:hypothetical protein n=1 Tax=Sphaerisporangium sp. TRM90804 TaxID=3031113 RepID=UPI002446C4D9|nr:hypothetical protein [Sphaerisporangium sp. TRM90804]MDH2424814.1 hypothetical protein [Sphaerisporangium sp. TRM90804]